MSSTLKSRLRKGDCRAPNLLLDQATLRPVMWELIFMMLILKIPIVYLCLVVYWAVKAEPKPPEPALLPVLPEQPPYGPRPLVARRRPPRRPSRGGPHTPRGGTRRTRAARAIS